MFVIPAVDIWEDKAIKYDRKTKAPETVWGGAKDMLRRWIEAGAQTMHIVDLDGALERRDNFWVMDDAIRTVSLAGVMVQVGGGFRRDERIQQYLEPPIVERVVVSTRAIEEPKWLETIAKRWPKRVLLALDTFGEKLATHGWMEESKVTVEAMLERTKGLPLAGIMYTNLNVEGKAQGVDWAPVEKLMKKVDKPVIFSGGTTSVDDVKRYRDLGAFGVVIGSALYTGKIDIHAALKAGE